MKVLIGNQIKVGANSTIFEGLFPLKIIIKRFSKSINNIDYKSHKKILELIESKHVIHLYGSQNTSEYSEFYLENCESTLENYLKEETFSINKIKKVFSQLNEAFKLMVKNKIIHRNLNTSNILIKSLNDENIIVKLGGFSKSTFSDKVDLLSSYTPYDAPEIINNQMANLKSDLWSIGIILYELLFLFIIPSFNSFGDISNNLNDNDLKDLINRLLKKNPNERINWDDYFSHPFFTENNKENFPIRRSQSTPLANMEINLLKMEIDDHKAKINKISNENIKLKKIINDTKQQNLVYQKKLSDFEANNSLYTNKLKSENNILNDRIDNLSSEYIRAKQTFQDTQHNYEKQLHDKDMEINKLNGSLKELDQITKALNVKHNKNQKIIDKYKSKYGDID